MKRSYIKRGNKPLGSKPKTEKRKHTEYLDYFFSTLIVLRDKTCFYCGCPAELGHHIFMKGAMHLHLRFDWINDIGMCAPCHSPIYGRGIHAVPHLYQAKLEEAVDRIHGRGTYERLEARAYMQGGGMPDLMLVEIELKQVLWEHCHKLPANWSVLKLSGKTKFLRGIRKGVKHE